MTNPLPGFPVNPSMRITALIWILPRGLGLWISPISTNRKLLRSCAKSG